MAVALKIFVCYLTAKFLAYALVLIGTLRTAGAVSAGSAQPLLYSTHHILVFVQTDFRCSQGHASSIRLSTASRDIAPTERFFSTPPTNTASVGMLMMPNFMASSGSSSTFIEQMRQGASPSASS